MADQISGTVVECPCPGTIPENPIPGINRPIDLCYTLFANPNDSRAELDATLQKQQSVLGVVRLNGRRRTTRAAQQSGTCREALVFLWSSPPDNELYAADLSDSNVIGFGLEKFVADRLPKLRNAHDRPLAKLRKSRQPAGADQADHFPTGQQSKMSSN